MRVYVDDLDVVLGIISLALYLLPELVMIIRALYGTNIWPLHRKIPSKCLVRPRHLLMLEPLGIERRSKAHRHGLVELWELIRMLEDSVCQPLLNVTLSANLVESHALFSNGRRGDRGTLDICILVAGWNHLVYRLRHHCLLATEAEAAHSLLLL